MSVVLFLRWWTAVFWAEKTYEQRVESFENANNVRGTSLKAQWKQPKTSRSNDKLKFHFVTMMMKLLSFFSSPHETSEMSIWNWRQQRRIKILEDVYFSCILIGLFAFWPYTDGSFQPLSKDICKNLKTELRSVQLVKVSYKAILHIEMIRIFFIHFLSFSLAPRNNSNHLLCTLYLHVVRAFTQPFVLASSSEGKLLWTQTVIEHFSVCCIKSHYYCLPFWKTSLEYLLLPFAVCALRQNDEAALTLSHLWLSMDHFLLTDMISILRRKKKQRTLSNFEKII